MKKMIGMIRWKEMHIRRIRSLCRMNIVATGI